MPPRPRPKYVVHTVQAKPKREPSKRQLKRPSSQLENKKDVVVNVQRVDFKAQMSPRSWVKFKNERDPFT